MCPCTNEVPLFLSLSSSFDPDDHSDYSLLNYHAHRFDPTSSRRRQRPSPAPPSMSPHPGFEKDPRARKPRHRDGTSLDAIHFVNTGSLCISVSPQRFARVPRSKLVAGTHVIPGSTIRLGGRAELHRGFAGTALRLTDVATASVPNPWVHPGPPIHARRASKRFGTTHDRYIAPCRMKRSSC
jgi:hypothetical protein